MSIDTDSILKALQNYSDFERPNEAVLNLVETYLSDFIVSAVYGESTMQPLSVYVEGLEIPDEVVTSAKEVLRRFANNLITVLFKDDN